MTVEGSKLAWQKAARAYEEYVYTGTADSEDLIAARNRARDASHVGVSPNAAITDALTDINISPIGRVGRVAIAAEQTGHDLGEENPALLELDLLELHGDPNRFIKAARLSMAEHDGPLHIANLVIADELDPTANGRRTLRERVKRHIVRKTNPNRGYSWYTADGKTPLRAGNIETLATLAAYYGEDSLALALVETITDPRDIAEIRGVYPRALHSRAKEGNVISACTIKMQDEGSRSLLKLVDHESAYGLQLAEFVHGIPREI